MKNEKAKRRISAMLAVLLTAVLLLSAGAWADDSDPIGEIKLRVRSYDGEDIPEYTVAIYKVADYEEGKNITLTEEFALCGLTLNEVADGQKAQETSEKLTAFFEGLTEKPEPYMTATSGEDGYAVFKKVADGLYYVSGLPDKETEYKYARKVEFGAFIVAMPSFDDSTKVFMRQVECKPKCEIEHLKGDLIITKELLHFAPAAGTTFVFDIVAKMENEKGELETVYANTVSIKFSSAGTQEYVIRNAIPVGAEVTVTELYTGTAYKTVGSTEQTTVILLTDDEHPDVATVEFVNDYDEPGGPGGSHLNEFSYDEEYGWQWVAENEG